MANAPELRELAVAPRDSDLRSNATDGLEDLNVRDGEDAKLIGKPLISKEVDPKTAGETSTQDSKQSEGPSLGCRLWQSFRARLKVLVKSSSFNLCCMVVIILSSVLLGFEAGATEEESESSFFRACGHIITVLFILEWVIRLLASGPAFFKDPVNFLFTIVVWVPFFISAAPQFNSARVAVRCLRLGKVIHTIKDVKMLRTVWLLVTGLFGSAMTLMWSCMLIFFTVFFFSILAVEFVGHSDHWEDAEIDEMFNNCTECYWAVRLKTVSSAMFVMTRFMNHDGAMDVMEAILTRQKHIWLFFYSFMAISVYVLLNLVTAIIVDRALQIAMQDEDQQVKEAMESRQRELSELAELFSHLDVDCSGSITKDEFNRAFKIEALHVKLQLMGIHEKDLQEVFDMLNVDATDGNATLDIQEFCKGLPKMFGDAKSYDMLKAQKLLERCEKHFDDILEGAGMQAAHRYGRERTIHDIHTLADMMNFLDATTKDRMDRLEQGVRHAMDLVEKAATSLAC